MESLKSLPYSEEKALYGYRVIEKFEDGYSKVLLIVAQESVINYFTGILNKAQLTGLNSVSLSSEALLSWFMINRPSEKGNIMLVNLDLGHIDIDIVEDGRLVFTRGVVLSAADKIIPDKIIGEIVVSMHTYHKESGKPLTRIVLTGNRAEAESCKNALSAKIDVPAEIIDQAAGIDFKEGSNRADADVSFAELFGLCMKPENAMINLIPEEAEREGRFTALRANLITAIFLSAICAAALLCLVAKKVHDRQVYLSVISAELKNMEPKVAKAKKMMKDIAVIRETKAKKPLAIDCLSEITSLTPSGISLGTVEYESEKTITVRGSAPALSDCLKYVSLLDGSPLFEGVKIKYANKRMAENREVTDFEINADLTKLK